MPQQETTLLRIPREGPVADLELRVSRRNRGSHYVRGVHIREWWLPPAKENSVPTRNGIVIRLDELDAVLAALTEAKRLMEYTRMPWQKEVPCPRCQSMEARQAGAAGSLPTDYYCGLCGAVDGPLRNEPPVIDLRGDESHNWLQEVRKLRLEREQREGTADSAA